jgi:hypothetical protein
MFPTVEKAKELALTPIGADSGPLVYNGGPVMLQANIYQIFWVPAKLQNGGATSMTTSYQSLQRAMVEQYVGHQLHDIITQYYQTISGTVYPHTTGGLLGYYVDTNAYPASGCTDSLTPGGCITDAQLQAEIQRVMTLEHWTAAGNKIFMMYTSSGEGSCFDSSSTQCAYSYYCAYHSGTSGTTPFIYSNEPYGDTTHCQSGGTPSPNGNAAADAATSTASHELSESISDPFGDAWITAQGNEVGDLCAYNYGTNTWDSAKANQMWSGVYLELQMEFDNHTGACAQVGP